MVRCRVCDKEKDPTEFHQSGRCKSCEAKRLREWRASNPAKAAEINWRHNGIDITYDEYLTKLADQDDVCAICEGQHSDKAFGKTRALSVDHNHETGLVRGLLCGAVCNQKLGWAENHLPNLIKYLAEYEPEKLAQALIGAGVMDEAESNER